MKNSLKYSAIFIVGGIFFLSTEHLVKFFLQDKSHGQQSEQSQTEKRDDIIDINPLKTRRDNLRQQLQKMRNSGTASNDDALANQFMQMRQQMLQMIEEQTNGIDFKSDSIDGASSFTQSEDKSNYYWEIPIENIDENSLKIDVQDGLINISGQSKLEQEDQNNGSLSQSTYISSFHKSFPIPENTDVSKVKIEKKDKKLQIVLPKNS